MAYFENRHIGDTVSRFGSLESVRDLDSATEEAVKTNLRKLDTTRVMIAHREATINMADRVLALQGGQLQEILKN
ncbi:MAG: hypothetical protein ABR522_02810 [Marinobacter sp.]